MTIEEAKRDYQETLQMFDSNGYYKQQGFGDYSFLYLETTENIKGCLEQMQAIGNRVLTSCGSGDQAFNFILQGAKEVTCFDCNHLAQYGLYLRQKAIELLDYEDFEAYMCRFPTENQLLSFKIYSQIREHFAFPYQYYWDQVYHNMSMRHIQYQLYRRCKHIFPSQKLNMYMEPNEFVKLKGKLKKAKVSFIASNLSELHNHIHHQSYDLIWLSNIYDLYAYDQSSHEKVLKFSNEISQLEKHLSDNGQMMMAYCYEYDKNTNKKFMNSDDHLFVEMRKKYAMQYDYNQLSSYYKDNTQLIEFDRASYIESSFSNDSALIYRKSHK